MEKSNISIDMTCLMEMEFKQNLILDIHSIMNRLDAYLQRRQNIRGCVKDTCKPLKSSMRKCMK